MESLREGLLDNQPSREELRDQYLALESKTLTQLNTLAKIVEDNKIYYFGKPGHNLNFNPKQAEVLGILGALDNLGYSYNPYKNTFTFTGGNRSGKTALGVIIDISILAGEWLWNGKKISFPHTKPRKIRLIGQDWEKHIKGTIVPALKEWWPKKRPLRIKKNTLGVEALWIDELTGSTLEIMSDRQDAGLHEGWHGDWIHYDEPPRREIYIANLRGLIDRNGKSFFGMTLLKQAWVDREIIKATTDKDQYLPNGMLLPEGSPDPSIFNTHAVMGDNVGYGINQKGMDDFSSKLTEKERKERVEGIPAYLEGLVYPQFNRETHLINRIPVDEINKDWILDIAIDVHAREKQAILGMLNSPDGTRYLIDEVFEHGDGTWIGQEVIRRIEYYGCRVGKIIIDPYAKSDSNNPNCVYDQVDRVLANHGYYLRTASKDKRSGILGVKENLKTANNQPSLYIFRDLVYTIFEFEGYMYDKESQKPQDKDDHMMENLYRLLLQPTEYYEEEWEEPEDLSSGDSINSAGY